MLLSRKARKILRAARGICFLLVSSRYVHTPNELLSLKDLENTARLLAAFCGRIKTDHDFTRALTAGFELRHALLKHFSAVHRDGVGAGSGFVTAHHSNHQGVITRGENGAGVYE